MTPRRGRIKLTQVCPRYYPYMGGVEKYVRENSEALLERGFEVEVFATDPSGKLPVEEIVNGVCVKRFKSFAPSDIGYFSKSLFDALKRTKCDIVHAHGYRALPMLLAALAKSENEAKLIVTPHLSFSKVGRPFYLIYNPFFGRFIFSKADKITIVSPAELEAIPILRKFENKVVLSPVGIDFAEIKECFDQDRSSRILKLIYVGRIEKRKGLDNLIEVMNTVRELPIRLTIVGEGPYEPKILPVIHEMQNVEFSGRVSEQELCRLYASSHTFVLLSEFESHSVSLTEAMAFGVVPIVSNVGGNRYVVDEETGFLVGYPVKVDEVVQLLRRLCDNEKILKEKSVAAKNKASTSFNIENTTGQLVKLYKEILI